MTAAYTAGVDQDRLTCEAPGCVRVFPEPDGQDGLCPSCAAEDQDHRLGLHDDEVDIDCPLCW